MKSVLVSKIETVTIDCEDDEQVEREMAQLKAMYRPPGDPNLQRDGYDVWITRDGETKTEISLLFGKK